ncbi:MAG: spermidine/putrescine ABC transporter substrate-binding protein, partial [Huintestinicola sp.]
MKKRLLKSIAAAAAAMVICSMLAACGDSSEETEEDEEETEIQTLTIEDEEYYSRFRDAGISINVYNWGEYISDGSEEGTLNVNAEFTALTGIKVNYTNYATNEELYAKLKGGGASYDIIIPSDYMISRMIKEGMIQKLD